MDVAKTLVAFGAAALLLQPAWAGQAVPVVAPPVAAPAVAVILGPDWRNADAAEQKLVSESDAKLQKIAADCKPQGGTSSDPTCILHFDQYDRSMREHASNGGLNIPGIVKASGLTFWGLAQDLTYTEVKYPFDFLDSDKNISRKVIEYQIGFGYIIYSKQLDAKIDAQGSAYGLALAGNVSGGGTAYSAMLIGLAPTDPQINNGDPNKLPFACGDRDLDAPHQMLCALDPQPIVTQAYFEASAAKLASTYNAIRNILVDARVGDPSSLVCPQIINYRLERQGKADEKLSKAQRKQRREAEDKFFADNADGVALQVIHMNNILSQGCSRQRANARMGYHSGAPKLDFKAINSVTVSVDDGKAKGDSKQITQVYYRDTIFLAATPKHHWRYYSDEDHIAQITMSGLTDSAKLPSILASIVNYSRTDLTQRIHVATYCAKGAALVGPEDNPVANATAFTKLVDTVRTNVDAADAPKPCVDGESAEEK